MTTCLRCGKCCWYIIPNKEGKNILKKCKHLVRNFRLGTTRCREYNKRKQLRTQNGIIIDNYCDKKNKKQKVFCIWRDVAHFNYEGCPFNVKGKMNFETYCEKEKVECR